MRTSLYSIYKQVTGFCYSLQQNLCYTLFIDIENIYGKALAILYPGAKAIKQKQKA